jgi:AraC-like DNA-binding protein
MIDFREVVLKKHDLYFVAPGQVHHQIRIGEGEVWYAAVSPALIPADHAKVLESHLLLQSPCSLSEASFEQCRQIAQLLSDQFHGDPDADYYKPLTLALLHAFLCAAARAYLSEVTVMNRTSRPYQITLGFKKLLAERFRSEKSPSFYAGLLHISEIYLNEAVKHVTGFTVTWWIAQEVITEAKRLLCYSQLNVKEIAWQLGYQDHTYFSRLFKKTTKTTPLTFRASYLK